MAARLAERFGLTEGQTAVLELAGTALASERDLSARLAAVVAVGELARVGLQEEEFLANVRARVRAAYGPVSVGLVSGGKIAVDGRRYDPTALAAGGRVHAGGVTAYPLTVRGRVAGVLQVPHDSGDPALPAALANRLSVALENARLYRELETLFRAYLSPDVVAALLADPGQADLGGSLVEVTALRGPAWVHHLLGGRRAPRDRDHAQPVPRRRGSLACWITAGPWCSSSATLCSRCSTPRPGSVTMRRGRCGPR